MKFLDLNGLTHFWSKIKDWSNSNFFSKKGGEISPKSGLHYIINGEQLDVSKTGNENESISIFNVDENGISAERIVMTGGTATQVLMADGSVKTLNANNGIAGLDSNGNVPLAQLGNLDTTVAEVVTALPTTNIKKHIYLIKDASNVTQNKYEEYIYTGDTSATYDASKWEKLGDFRATVDLANYYTKSQVDSIANGKSSTSHTHSVIINGVTKTIAASGGAAVNLGTYLTNHQSLTEYAKKSEAATSLEITPSANDIQFVLKAISGSEIDWPSLNPATSTEAGIMTTKDKVKLDGIAPNANNYSLPLAANGTRGGIQLGYAANGRNYPVQLSGEKAYVNVPWTDTNTTYGLATSTNDGLMSKADKTKIDNIDTIYAKKSDTIREVNVNPTTSDSEGEIIELEFANENSDPICYANLPLATIMNCGLMHSHDKAKLDEIDNRATADSAITTAEIDALFA